MITHFDTPPEAGNIYHCDWRVLVEALPDASIDAVIADPPYNLTELDFEQPIDWTAFWEIMPRKLKRSSSPVILFSQQPFTTDLIGSNRKWFRDEIIYEKAMPTGYLNAKKYPLQTHENIIVFAAAAPDYYPQFEESSEIRFEAVRKDSAEHYNESCINTYKDTGKRYPRSVWRFAQRKSAFKLTETRHRTEKPLGLMERVVLNYTLPDAVVLDCFCGSGSTLEAAHRNGRQFIGCDTSLESVETSRARAGLPVSTLMFSTLEQP